MLFAVPAPEGLADWVKVRLLSSSYAAEAFVGDSVELRRFPRLSESLTAATYSPDGSLLAIGAYRRLDIYDRRSRRLRAIPIEVSYFYTMSFSPDNRIVAWLGECHAKPAKGEPNDLEVGYLPDVNAFGLSDIRTSNTTAWQVSRIEATYPGLELALEQHNSCIAVSDRRDALYFLCLVSDHNRMPRRCVARFDLKRQSVEIVARDVQGFTLEQ